MKIIIRNQPADAPEGTGPGQACVWVVGDDGETVSTEYLAPGQQVDIETEGAVSSGEVGPIPEAPTEEPSGELPDGAVDESGPPAGGAQG